MAVEHGDDTQRGDPLAAVSMLVAKLAERDAMLADYQATITDREATIADHEATITDHETTIAQRETMLVEHQSTLEDLRCRHERLRRLYEALKVELQLVKRRMFVAKAERVDTTSLQLEFEDLVGQLDALAGVLPPETRPDEPEARSDVQVIEAQEEKRPSRPKPKGRRNLEEADLPEETIEIVDELFEDLRAQGKAERIGAEESFKLSYKRGGFWRLRISRVKYRAVGSRGVGEIETAPLPQELLPRCLATASTLARIATHKFHDGLPLYRQQDILARGGATVDRGTMSRWLADLGGTFGASIVEAMDQDARRRAFCILTDATGFLIQPGARDGPRRPCRKGHYFVRIADRDHILFDYTPKHTSSVVRAMFRGFEGYVQADAASVYDVLFRPPGPDDSEFDGSTRIEVACWSHARRKYWEAALCQQIVARQALLRVGKIFEVDARLTQGNPPSKIHKLRNQHLRPLVEEFIEFAQAEYEKVEDQRGPLRSALGYTVRQADALQAFLGDGRLRLDNNPSEAALRKVVRIRDASLFAGSDEHAECAGHILSLLASARLHQLDPERYLRDVIRLLPLWPRERYLELAPKFWAATRARLNTSALDADVGPIDVPETALADAEQ